MKQLGLAKLARRKVLIGTTFFTFLILVPASAGLFGGFAALARPPAPALGETLLDLNVSPREIAAGELVAVRGTGCEAVDNVRFELYSPYLSSEGSVATDSDGSFESRIQIPPMTKSGRAWLRAICAWKGPGNRTFEATLLVKRQILVGWINLFFGIGTTLVVASFGLAVRRRPPHKSRRPSGNR